MKNKKEKRGRIYRMHSLENIDMVVITTSIPQDSSKSTNGGDYYFWTEYRPVGDGFWKLEYNTTAEFMYCPVMGVFQECDKCGDWDCEEGICLCCPGIITEEDLMALITKYPFTVRSGDQLNPDITVINVDGTDEKVH